jgi:hypothetical protein
VVVTEKVVKEMQKVVEAVRTGLLLDHLILVLDQKFDTLYGCSGCFGNSLEVT